MNRLAKKNSVTMAPNRNRVVMFAVRSVGRRKMPSGISGDRARSSMITNASSRAAAPIRLPMVRPVAHPTSTASLSV